MEKIRINHKFNESSTKVEEQKIKWFISVLEKKYSAKDIEISINQINKEANERCS